MRCPCALKLAILGKFPSRACCPDRLRKLLTSGKGRCNCRSAAPCHTSLTLPSALSVARAYWSLEPQVLNEVLHSLVCTPGFKWLRCRLSPWIAHSPVDPSHFGRTSLSSHVIRLVCAVGTFVIRRRRLDRSCEVAVPLKRTGCSEPFSVACPSWLRSWARVGGRCQLTHEGIGGFTAPV